MFLQTLHRFLLLPENFLSTVRVATVRSLHCVGPIGHKSCSYETTLVWVSWEVWIVPSRCFWKNNHWSRKMFHLRPYWHSSCWKNLKMTHLTGTVSLVLVGCFNISKAYKTVCHSQRTRQGKQISANSGDPDRRPCKISRTILFELQGSNLRWNASSWPSGDSCPLWMPNVYQSVSQVKHMALLIIRDTYDIDLLTSP